MLPLATLIVFTLGERCAALDAPAWRQRLRSAIPALEREVVLVPDAPTQDDLKALAVALHADLARDGDAWRLYRSDATSDALRKADREWLRDQMAKAAARDDALAQRYAKSPVEGPFEAMRAGRARFDARPSDDVLDDSGMDANAQTPAARLLAELLRGLLDHVVEEAKPGGDTVFSNAPVGTERPLSVQESVLANYAAAEARFAEWSEKARARDEIPHPYRWAFAPGVYRPGRRTLQLYVSRNDVLPVFALSVFDPTGRREAVAQLMSQDLDDVRNLAPRRATALGQVALPAEALAALGPDAPATDPSARDPLDLYVRDALLLWAKAKGYDRVVGCVPDILLEGAKRCVAGSMLDLDAFEGALDRAGCERLTSGKTLVVRPAQPLQEEGLRIDRRPLSALYRAASRGTFGLDDLFAYHAAYADSYESRWMLQRMERPLWNAFGIGSATASNVPHAVLATLGTLSPNLRHATAGGGRVSLDSPAFAACRRALARYVSVYGKSSFSVDREDPVSPGTIRWVPETATVVGSDLDRTATHVLARPGPRWLDILPGESHPLIRRVSKADGKVVDARFTSIGMFVGGPFQEERYQNLDASYRFLWAEERATPVRVTLDSGIQVGPFVLREQERATHGPVPLDQVPGIARPKAAP